MWPIDFKNEYYFYGTYKLLLLMLMHLILVKNKKPFWVFFFLVLIIRMILNTQRFSGKHNKKNSYVLEDLNHVAYPIDFKNKYHFTVFTSYCFSCLSTL